MSGYEIEVDEDSIKEKVREAVEEVFFSDDEHSPFNLLQEKINKLLDVAKYESRLDVSIATCDKFEDYMKNIDRLNQMINEFKGMVAIVRGEAKVVKDENEKLKKQMRNVLKVLQELEK